MFQQVTAGSFIAADTVGALSLAGVTGDDSATGIDLVTITQSP